MTRLLAIAALCLSACATIPPVPAAPWVGRYKNACVPEAAAMAEGLRGAKIQSRVLILKTPRYSHAVTAYLYPSGNAAVWVWDPYWKSTTVRAWWEDPAGIATAWLAKCGRPERVTSAYFLEPVPEP